MNFDKASAVDMVCWNLRYADWFRAQDRTEINRLFNGHAPYSAKEADANNISINVNDLTATRLSHDARAQFYSAFLKPGSFFNCTTDAGPKHKRRQFSTIVTKEINRVMKRSLKYYECFRSKFALDVLHGIGPSHWDSRDRWCPTPLGVEDVLIPAGTLLTMENLPLYAIWRSYTANQFIRMTTGSKTDKAWNEPFVKSIIRWIDEETQKLLGTTWPEYWQPEKVEERVKGDGAFYASDQCPTVDVFDFYFWSDEGGVEGWRRRMILDSWGMPGSSGALPRPEVPSRKSGDIFKKDDFLYNPGDRCYGSSLSEIVSFQFADLSAVGPFRYHTVRSLGFLLYSVCHLQNRMRCKMNEAVFEALTMYYRVQTLDDVQRALKIQLGQGFVDDSIKFLAPEERWQPNSGLIELGLEMNQRLIQDNSGVFTQQSNLLQDRTEKTKFEVMAKLNAMTTLVSAALGQAYAYQEIGEYPEIFRRFCNGDSGDVEVKQFRAACLKQGVPAKILSPECWELKAERIMGAGNKSLEMAIAEQMMQFRTLFDPPAQRDILRDFVLAITDDPGRSQALVPDEPDHISNSVHDAQLAAGSLMQGLPVAVKPGINHTEYVEALLVDLQLVVARANKTGMTTPDKLEGMERLAAHIGEHIKIIAQDKNEKDRVKEYADKLTKLMNDVRALAQRLQEQAAKQNGQPQIDPKDQAKVQAMLLQAQTKAKLAEQSHAQRTAQRQIQFEQKLHQDSIQHAADIHKKDIETEADVNRGRLSSLEE